MMQFSSELGQASTDIQKILVEHMLFTTKYQLLTMKIVKKDSVINLNTILTAIPYQKPALKCGVRRTMTYLVHFWPVALTETIHCLYVCVQNCLKLNSGKFNQFSTLMQKAGYRELLEVASHYHCGPAAVH